MKYELISTKRNMVLGTIECDNLEAAELFLAMNFPDDFFGANIKGIDCDSVACIPVERAFKGENDISPVAIALRNFDSKIKVKNGLCYVEENSDGALHKPYKKLKSEAGGIVKDASEAVNEDELLLGVATTLNKHGFWENTSTYRNIMQCFRHDMFGEKRVSKTVAKISVEKIMCEYGLHSGDSLWEQMTYFINRVYS
jgi:hypothetical protein